MIYRWVGQRVMQGLILLTAAFGNVTIQPASSRALLPPDPGFFGEVSSPRGRTLAMVHWNSWVHYI